MMKLSPLFVAAALTGLSQLTSAQCVADFDFGTATYGASPDASVGEQFDTAYVGEPYADVFHVLVPEDASDIEPTVTFPLDSVILTSATLIDTETLESFDFTDVGLDIVCNNGGVSDNPCTLIAPGQYCANLEGVPTQAGVYQMSLNVLAYITVFGQAVGQPFEFSGYILDIVGTNSVESDPFMHAAAIYPNPASDAVSWELGSKLGDMISWRILDITGRTVLEGSTTKSRLEWSVADWNDGMYFVNVTAAGKTTTRRLLVQH